MRLSPVQVVAGVAAVVLAIAGLVLATRLREAAVDMLSAPRHRAPATSVQAPPQPDAKASPAGVRVIPIGVAPANPTNAASSPQAARPGGR
jgi:hypothetical protein